MRNNPRPEVDGSSTVLVIDDDASVRSAIVNVLESLGRACLAFACVEDFLAWSSKPADLCLALDVRMPGRNRLDSQEELARTRPEIAIVMITAYGDIPMSVRAMKAGAMEFLPKPSVSTSCSTPSTPALRALGSDAWPSSRRPTSCSALNTSCRASTR